MIAQDYTRVKDYLNKTKLKSLDYVINPYVGCPHKCLYCYANIDKESAFENYRRHDKYSPVLIGSIDRIKDKITKRNQKDTKSLKKVDKVIAKQGSIEDMLNI